MSTNPIQQALETAIGSDAGVEVEKLDGAYVVRCDDAGFSKRATLAEIRTAANFAAGDRALGAAHCRDLFLTRLDPNFSVDDQGIDDVADPAPDEIERMKSEGVIRTGDQIADEPHPIVEKLLNVRAIVPDGATAAWEALQGKNKAQVGRQSSVTLGLAYEYGRLAREMPVAPLADRPMGKAALTDAVWEMLTGSQDGDMGEAPAEALAKPEWLDEKDDPEAERTDPLPGVSFPGQEQVAARDTLPGQYYLTGKSATPCCITERLKDGAVMAQYYHQQTGELRTCRVGPDTMLSPCSQGLYDQAAAEAQATNKPAKPTAIKGQSVEDRDPRIPEIGTVISREHAGAVHDCTVSERDGRVVFVYRGEDFSSLSKLGRQITGKSVNGYVWWGLGNRDGAKPRPKRTEEERAEERLQAMLARIDREIDAAPSARMLAGLHAAVERCKSRLSTVGIE